MTTQHKGYWVRVRLRDGSEQDFVPRPNNKAELLYMMKRRLIHIPRAERMTAYINQHELVYYDLVPDPDNKETRYMIDLDQTFTSFDDLHENFVAPKEEREFAYDNAAVREMLAFQRIPFTIVHAWEEASPFKDSKGRPQVAFRFDIRLHTDSRQYQNYEGDLDIRPAYTLTLTTSTGYATLLAKRRAALKFALTQIESLGGCNAVLAKGGENGKEYYLKSSSR